jgi:putative ABC transport system permease protein
VPRIAGVAAEGSVNRIGISQILSSLRHRKGAYASLVLEVALGCTVVAFMLGLGKGLRDITHSPLGYDADRTFVVAFEQPPDPGADFAARLRNERAEIAALPGVELAAWAELPPMSRRELPVGVTTPSGESPAWSLRGDPQLIDVLGLHVAAGRALRDGDATSDSGTAPALRGGASSRNGSTPVLVSRDLEAVLGFEPVGTTLRSPQLGTLSVVGVIDEKVRLSPFFGGENRLIFSVAAPSEARRSEYLVRTDLEHAGNFANVAALRLNAPVAQAPALRGGTTAQRFVEVARLSDERARQERNVTGADTVIGITVFGMVLVVLVGSLGMASSLVVERTRQIGIRRALGARRSDIVGQFMLESLVATLLGIAVGTGMCAALDAALTGIKGNIVIQWYAFLPVAAVLFLVSGQVAALVPALRAASIEPSVVSRTA